MCNNVVQDVYIMYLYKTHFNISVYVSVMMLFDLMIMLITRFMFTIMCYHIYYKLCF